MRLLVSPALLLPFALLSSCASATDSDPELSNSQSLPIAGGVDDPTDSAIVGMIGLESPTSGTSCSGSLIAPNLVLTARHCVAASPGGASCGNAVANFGALRPAAQFSVTTQWDYSDSLKNLKLTGTWYKVSRIVVPSEGNSLCGYDLALVVLEKNIPSSEATPIAPALHAPVTVDQAYSAVGFGLPTTGRRVRLDGLVVKCTSSCPDGLLDAQREWQGDKGALSGDSGGPALDLNGQVVGVASRSDGTISAYESVYVARDWVRTVTYDTCMASNNPVPAWVTSDGALLGAACSKNEECASSICQNDDLPYCSRSCSKTTPCPANYTCNTTSEQCTKKSDVGRSCVADTDCNSKICIKAESGAYCSQACSPAKACPANYTCSAQANCQLDQIEEFSAAKKSTGCSLSSPADLDLSTVGGVLFLGMALGGRRLRARKTDRTP